jgi:uncharacterized protein
MNLPGVEWFAGFMVLGFAIGAYGTLIGAGGGFILMPLLLVLYPHEPPQNLTAISLAVVFFNALSGSVAYARMKRIDYRSGLMFAAAATPGAVIGALNTSMLSRWQFNLIFSLVLIGVAVAMAVRPELHRNPRKKGRLTKFEVRRHLVEADGTCLDWTFQPLVGLVLSFFVGYFSSFLGIGGGIIHVPALVWLLNFPVHVATATSHFILAIMALSGTLVHWEMGTLSHGLSHTLPLAGGVLLGAQLGAYFSSRIRSAWIIRSLAVALGLVGMRILFTSFHWGQALFAWRP